MSIKDDELYPIYICYLENKKMSNGAFKLALISEDLFNNFVFRYDSEPHFREKQDNLYKSIKRDIVLDEILEDKDEFELFLDELDATNISKKNEGDIFDF
jgi:hypothetical protein